MNRQLILATLALATVAASGCGSSGPEAAGKKIGQGVGALQSTVMVKTASERLDGIEKQIDGLKGDLPADTFAQLEQIKKTLDDDTDAATNHPDALAATSTKAYEALTALSGNGDVSDFVKGVKDGYASATAN